MLRFFPIPTKTGIRKVGNPDETSPVLITGNYILTVSRLLRSLKGMDCYILVANSRGVNVWCAATGGHFTTHEVIAALKTSGIEELVHHRTIILPQLAATGIDGRLITKKTKWRVKWGPVEAKDIPYFLSHSFEKRDIDKQVSFPLKRRLEMAIALAFPISLILSLIFIISWPDETFVTFSLPWISTFVFLIPFPVYEPLLKRMKRLKIRSTSIPFEWLVLLPLSTILLQAFVQIISGMLGSNSSDWLRWLVVSFITSGIITMDLMGVTPTYKSSMSKESFFHVTVDEERCKGDRF